MKTYNRTAPSKLLIRFDNELKNLLSNDLLLFLEKNRFSISKTRAVIPSTLSVA